MAATTDPPFTITNSMIELIGEISRRIGILTVGTNMSRNPRLHHANRIRSIHSSLAIENNTLTLEQVTDIIQGKHVLGPPSEIREVKNAFQAYEQLSAFDPYSVDDFLRAHNLMTSDLIHDSGKFRETGVGVFSGDTVVHMAPPASLVPELITNLFVWAKSSDVHPLIKSCVFHFELEFIHPFIDGNGRMGRLWQTLILSKWEPLFAWIPVESLIQESRQKYYDALGESGKKGNSTYFVEFMLTVISNALNMYEIDIKKPSVRLSEKEQTILDLIKENSRITILEIVEITGYPRSTVTRLMKNMSENSIIERVGSKKNGYWNPLGNY